jgi:hypothetical protein
MAGQLQSLGVDEIDVRGGDGKNDTVGLGDVLGDEVAGLLLDVCRLVANGYLQLLALTSPTLPVATYLGQTGQVDKRQAEDVWGVHLQVDRLPVDALVVSRYPRCLGFDLAPDLCEVVESAPGNVQKLSPFLLSCYAGGRVWHVDLIALLGIVALAREVDQLEDKRSPRDDAAASGKKVPADNVLEHRRLSRRLRAYDNLEGSVWRLSHAVARSSKAFASVLCCIAGASAAGATYNLGQIERVIADGVENEVLEPVDDVEELLAQRRHNAGERVRCWCSR